MKTRRHHDPPVVRWVFGYMEILAEKFLRWEGTSHPRAAENYRRSLSKFYEQIKKSIKEIDEQDFACFQNWLANNYAPSTVRFDITALKRFCSFLTFKKEDVIHPSLISTPQATPNPHRAIQPEEFGKLIKIYDEKNFWQLRELVIVNLLFETGVRISELCALNCETVGEEPKATIPTKKNNKFRQIFWSFHTHKLLNKYLETRLKISQNPPLFISQRGTRLTPRSIERFLVEAYKQAGISKIVPHSFRHGRCHVILDKTGDLAAAQRILGHKNISSTEWYTQFTDSELEMKARRCL